MLNEGKQRINIYGEPGVIRNTSVFTQSNSFDSSRGRPQQPSNTVNTVRWKENGDFSCSDFSCFLGVGWVSPSLRGLEPFPLYRLFAWDGESALLYVDRIE